MGASQQPIVSTQRDDPRFVNRAEYGWDTSRGGWRLRDSVTRQGKGGTYTSYAALPGEQDPKPKGEGITIGMGAVQPGIVGYELAKKTRGFKQMFGLDTQAVPTLDATDALLAKSTSAATGAVGRGRRSTFLGADVLGTSSVLGGK